MNKPVLALIFFLAFLCSYSQKIQTIVPGQVVIGNAFQIQYIINDPGSFVSLSPPRFDNLKLISGPNYYKGNSLVNGKTQAIQNITYTVVPLKGGTVKIYSVTASFKNDEEEKTEEVSIAVLPQPKASFNTLSTYTDINLYAPSSKANIDNLIEANLFIKTEVDKRVCFLGEAITATFKLYSRLQSTSEVMNAPSLYGFSVMDMLNINEAHQAVEAINGKIFNTSVLRKLQLYPAQTGKLTIDQMQLKNSIEFNDSLTGKKVKLEKVILSDPVDIMVKSLPSKQPAEFTGAVGRFTMRVELLNSTIAANTSGRLVVTVAGKGNFIQFGPPVINWPNDFVVFVPIISDQLDKTSNPTKGIRRYIFNFTTDQSGNFVIPPVLFSFFDVYSGQYRKLSSDSLNLEVTEMVDNGKNSHETSIPAPTKKSWIILVGIGVLFSIIATFFWKRQSVKNSPQPLTEKTNYIQAFNILMARQLPGKQFCSEIQKLLGNVNKEYSLTQQQKRQVQEIIKACELLVYSDINFEGEKEELQKKTHDLLKELQS